MLNNVYAWLDERLGLGAIYQATLDRPVPKVNWWYTLGSASLFLFTIQLVTGIFLTVYYVPTPDHAYDSVEFIMNEVTFGWLIRGVHHWGANLMVLFVFMHLLRTFYFAAYKFPREVSWLSGVVLFILTLGMGFTGYLLPWHQRAYWATTVGTEIAGTAPGIGEYALRILRGGTDLSALTLSRFFSLHIWVFPLAIGALILLHLYLLIRLGISTVPKENEDVA